MNDQLAERLCIALEAVALELAEANAKGTVPEPIKAFTPPRSFAPNVDPNGVALGAPAGPFPPIGGGLPPAPWVCPVHGTNKVVPAGVSQRTGKPYEAFMACGERGCNEKPPRIAQQAPARAVPASEGIQGRQLP